MSPEETQKMMEEFELRLVQEMEEKKRRAKEAEYQLFKLKREFGLSDEELESCRADAKLGMELAWLREKPYLYRVLSMAEHTAIAEKNPDLNDYRKRIVATALLWPTFEERNFILWPAGIVQALTEAILRSSGFDEVVALPV